MPKSKIRKKVKEVQAYKAEHPEVSISDGPLESPKWLAPTMVAGFIIGLFWIVVFYVTQTRYPIPNVGAWNMLIGFGFIGVGFGLATRWR
jgi:Cell division protein CrgA